MIRIAWLSFLLLAVPCGGLTSERGYDPFVGSVPREIHQLMREADCSPIAGFYDREAMLGSAFIYAERLLEGGDAAVFFACENDAPETTDRYKIVFKRYGYSEGKGFRYADLGTCPSEIYFREMPGGLTLDVGRDVKYLEEVGYNLWKNTRNGFWDEKALPLVANGHPLWVLNELQEGGVGYGLFCLDGDWYNVSYD